MGAYPPLRCGISYTYHRQDDYEKKTKTIKAGTIISQSCWNFFRASFYDRISTYYIYS